MFNGSYPMTEKDANPIDKMHCIRFCVMCVYPNEKRF